MSRQSGTDQDNALILGANCNKERALSAAREVNAALAECGFPLCRGNIMVNNTALALSVDEWRGKFEGWIERGDPQSLLQANVFFDLRRFGATLHWLNHCARTFSPGPPPMSAFSSSWRTMRWRWNHRSTGWAISAPPMMLTVAA